MALSFPDCPIPDGAGVVSRSLSMMFRMFHWRLWNEVKGMTPEQLDWRPSPEADSIGMILDHLIAIEAGLIEIVFLGRAVSEVIAAEELGTRLHRWGHETCKRRGSGADAYLSDLLTLYGRGMAHLAALTDEQLLETRRHLWPGEGIPLTEGVMHMAEHLSHHKGQIVYLAEMEGFPRPRTTGTT